MTACELSLILGMSIIYKQNSALYVQFLDCNCNFPGHILMGSESIDLVHIINTYTFLGFIDKNRHYLLKLLKF